MESLKFYAQFADVVVLARELNMEQVSEIYQAIVRDNTGQERGAYSYRNVLSRSTLHGCFG